MSGSEQDLPNDELIARFNEARDRGLWTPRSNSAYALLAGEAA
jgi:cobaltochelatase CobN